MNTAVSSYGSDPSGLVFGYLFSPDVAGRPIDSNAALDWLHGPGSDEGREFIWLHFNSAHAAAERWLQQHLELSEAFFEVLRERSRSTRIENAGQDLVAILNDIIYDFLFTESSQVATLYLCVDERKLISVRGQPLRSVDRLRSAVRAGEGFQSPLSLLIHLLRDQADVLVHECRRHPAGPAQPRILDRGRSGYRLHRDRSMGCVSQATQLRCGGPLDSVQPQLHLKLGLTTSAHARSEPSQHGIPLNSRKVVSIPIPPERRRMGNRRGTDQFDARDRGHTR